MQAHNFTKQDTVKGTNYTLLIKSEGILLKDPMWLPSRISINNGFFPDQGVRNYEFIPTGITSIGGLELEI
jgi:hypothetical protein